MTSSREMPPTVSPKRRFGLRPVRLMMGPQLFVKEGLPFFDPHDPYYFAVSLKWKQFGLLFVAAEVAINMIFAGLYSLQPGSVGNLAGGSFFGNFFFSLETLATVGYGQMYPATFYGHFVASFEILTGVVFTAMMTGLLFVRFSKPKAKVLYAKHPVVTTFNGKPTLMLRLGNGRNSLLHDATLTLHVLCRTTSEEGLRHASITDLPLVRPRLPVFAILYTIMHVIDETSPLSEFAADSPDLTDLRFFLTIVARDPAIGQQVSDIHAFEGGDLRFGMRYVDAVRTVSTKKVVADYTRLSDIEPADAWPVEVARSGEALWPADAEATTAVVGG